MQEHLAGWYVLLDGEHIATLEWLRLEDLHAGLYEFRLIRVTPDAEKIDYALRWANQRAPDKRVVLQHRVTGAFLTEDKYFVSLRDDSTAGLRALGRAELPPFCPVADLADDG
jgi:hypothetical protein